MRPRWRPSGQIRERQVRTLVDVQRQVAVQETVVHMPLPLRTLRVGELVMGECGRTAVGQI